MKADISSVGQLRADHLVSDNLTEKSDLGKTNLPSPRSY